MLKKVLILLLIIIALFTLPLTACSNADDPTTPTDVTESVDEHEALMLQIREDYTRYLQMYHTFLHLYLDDVVIEQYYGFYDGSVAVKMSVRGEVDHYIVVWNNGSFHSPEDARDLGLITEEDLEQIRNQDIGG